MTSHERSLYRIDEIGLVIIIINLILITILGEGLTHQRCFMEVFQIKSIQFVQKEENGNHKECVERPNVMSESPFITT